MAVTEHGLTLPGHAFPDAPEAGAGALWRSLAWFTAYRLFVAALMLILVAFLGGHITVGSRNLPLFVYAAAFWLAASLAGFALIRLRRHFLLQLLGAVVGDIVLVMLLTYASGGISSGLPLLLLASLAAAGLVGRGRLSLFFAAISSLGVLLEHTLQVLWHEGATAQYVQAGLISIGYFAIAILAHTLVRYLAESEQRAAQREIDLANLSQVNQLVIQDMHDGVLVVDERGVIRQHNARAEEMLGAMPRGRREVLLRDYAPRLSTRLKEWSVNPVTGFDPVSTTVLAQQMNVRIVPVGRTRKVGAVIFLEDLSQVQAQAQQMKLASMGRLTANIAHEIRNPLSAISHAAELLQEETMPNPTISRLLRIITDNSLRLDRIVQDVLRLNRGEPAASQTFRVGEFLALFIEQFCQSERLPAGLLAVEVNGDPKVRFDHGHFSQVLWNLCRNALRHCQRAEGSIRIAAGPPGRDNRVRLDLFDDGPGVPPQLRSQLFEPFFTTDAGGTGLGLYLAREICQANGATLEYVANPGGAQFTIVCQGA